MALEKQWDKYEAAILLDYYLQYLDGKLSRKEAIQTVSAQLRELAKKRNICIDDSYRNIKGITYQMYCMELAYKGNKERKPVSKLFVKIVKLCRKDKEQFDSVLSEARTILQTTEKTNQQSCTECSYERQTDIRISMIQNETDKGYAYTYPLIYKKLYEALRNEQEVADGDGALIETLYEKIRKIARYETIKEILDNVSWAFREGEKYYFLMNETTKSQSNTQEPCKQSTCEKTLTKESKIYYKEQVERLLLEFYPYGFRVGSPIELIRLRSHASARNIVLPESDEELNREIEVAGITISGKVYVLQASVIDVLCQKIRTIFESGVGVVFLDVLYDKENNFFEEHHITSAGMLKEILQMILPAYYYGINIVTPGEKKTEVEAILSEINRIVANGNIITVPTLKEHLVYIPIEKIVWTLSYSDNMIRIDEGRYFRTEDLVISDEDTQAIYRYVEEKCERSGFATISDIPLDNIMEENYELTESGLQKAVYVSVLKRDFLLNGKILTRSGEEQDLQSVLRKFCLDRAECTAQDVMAKMEELGNTPRKPVALQVLFDTMVRADKDRFVADNRLSFDVATIDSLLREHVGDCFAAIQSIPTFALFPMCGIPWNYSLLESYCYRFSKEYRLSVKEMNSKNAGFIASAACPMSYQDMLCDAAAKADVDLSLEALGAYFFNNGFTASRRYAMLPEIIEKAKRLREEG